MSGIKYTIDSYLELTPNIKDMDLIDEYKFVELKLNIKKQIE